VSVDRLNVFSPFEGRDPTHENQLTCALLVVLRLSPMAHAVWLRLVDPNLELQQLPPATFTTQRRTMRHAGEEDELADLVSVYLAPEEPLSGGGVVTASDRGQVLDAIIDYEGELLVVVENKIAEADDFQARNLNVTGARVRIAEGQEAIVVSWRDVLEAFLGLRERSLVAGAESGVLDDFLTYVEDHFPALGPFRTLALCLGNRFRQRRRLRQILGEAVQGEATESADRALAATPAGAVIGRDAYLHIIDDGANVALSLYPADTLTQARAFYSHPTALAGLRELRRESEWDAAPNFHFGHIRRGLCWTCNRTDLDRYVDIWTGRIKQGKEHELPQEQWEAYWAWLESERIACAEDKPGFDHTFTDSKRSKASPRPGIWLCRRWTLAEAERLDNSRGELTRQVREALDAALTAFGEPPLPAGPSPAT